MRQVGVCVRIGRIGCRCVWPCLVRNIRNNEIKEKETLINHIDRTKNLFRHNRNTVEHAGTTCSTMFRKCSGKPFSPEQAVARAIRRLQQFARKTCSGMFRQRQNNLNPTGGRVVVGFQVLMPDACSGCSGGYAPHPHVCGVFTP